MIRDAAGVAAVADDARRVGRFAIDFEFLWEKTYAPMPCLAQVAVAVGETAAAAPLRVVPWTGKAPAAWSEIDRLQDQQQLEQASRRIEARLKQARTRGDGEDQTRALIRWTQLRVALHGYETAVRWLREQRWPDDLLGQTALNLYYAGALRSYAQSYAWEIAQRERLDTRGRVDLKAWTMEQLYAEAHRALSLIHISEPTRPY